MKKSSNISKWVFGVLALISVAITVYFFAKGVSEGNLRAKWDKDVVETRRNLQSKEGMIEIELGEPAQNIIGDTIPAEWVTVRALKVRMDTLVVEDTLKNITTTKLVPVILGSRTLDNNNYTLDPSTMFGSVTLNDSLYKGQGNEANVSERVNVRIEPPTPVTELMLNWSYIKILLGILAILASAIVAAVVKGVNFKTILIILGAIVIIGGVSYLMSKGSFAIPYVDPATKEVVYSPTVHGIIEWGINFFYVTLGVSLLTIVYSVVRSSFK